MFVVVSMVTTGVHTSGWKCSRCDLTNNLWMNMTDGAILCGRRYFDGMFALCVCVCESVCVRVRVCVHMHMCMHILNLVFHIRSCIGKTLPKASC